jgi:Icc-related predicted phosphoesterase
MKILATSDIHGSHSAYAWLVQTARDRGVDGVVLAGDLLGYPKGFDAIDDAQRADARAIARILEAAERPIYYIMGNDDLVELAPESAWLISIHGRRVDLGNFNLVGYQYSLPFMGGVFEKPEEDVRRDLGSLVDLVDARTVLVTHSPAYGILDAGMLGTAAGSRAILELVQSRNFRAHIHGHIHEHFGRVARHFNVASGGRHLAMLIDLETMRSDVVGDVGGAT